jgi:hypothetical protein
MGLIHDAEASFCDAFYGAQCSFVYRTGESFFVTFCNVKNVEQC